MHLFDSPKRTIGRVAVLAVLLLAALGAPSTGQRSVVAQETLPAPPPEQTPQADVVSQIRILGNDTISTDQVAGHLATRVGRPFDRSIVQRDVRRLANLGWFVDVKPLYDSTPQGRIVIFQVVERPTIRYVTYLGNRQVSDKNLGKQTNLKAGGAVDPYAVEEGRRKLQEYYQGRGFNNIQITIIEGAKATDQGIVYLINEGKSQRVWKVTFIGNQFVSDGRLKTLIKSKPPKFKLFKGYVSRQQIDNDVDQLTAYYRSFGFFQARVSRKVDYNEKGNWVNLTFVILEGPRYQVRSVKFLGNTKFEPEALAAAAKLNAGMPFEQTKVLEDARWLQQLYGSHGYVFADIKPEPVFLEEPGDIDLIYHIDEGERFRVGRVIVHIAGDNPHTRIQTALNRMSVRPGEIVDIREIKASERRLLLSSLFESDAATGIRPKITYRISEEGDYEFAKQPRPSRRRSNPRGGGLGGSGMRGQSPDDASPSVLPPPGYRGASKTQASKPLEIHIQCKDMAHYRRWVEAETNSQTPSNSTPSNSEEIIIRGQSPSAGQQSAYASLPSSGSGSPYGGRIVGATGPASKPTATQPGVQQAQFSESIPPPAGAFGPTPGFTANSVPGYQLFPDGRFGFPGQPYPEQTVDIIFEGQETQTGRLVFGVGVNSDAGVVGNIVLDERNFDWRRPPRSFEDLRNGQTFRGAGQRFRMDASPGSEVNRYLVSFQEPYLFDSPISFGLSGSLFDRRFRDWDEERLGGRVSVGRQWVEHDVSANLSYRGESVRITNPANGATPFADLDLVATGDSNQIHGFRLTVINDTRDSSFLPTQGHYFEGSGEFVTGTFDYPRVMADFRQYYLLRERPDHSGRHVLSASTNVGWLGDDAPIFERFYAGGFSTMRGFDFRGAAPVTFIGGRGIETGGNFQWLNSLQYLFPITADEMLHGVAFVDFGTVEREVKIEDFRVAPGVGLRVTVPAMGPAPIALDFAWAINEANFDDTEVFSFSMGFSR